MENLVENLKSITSFEDLIYPVSLNEFKEKYWDKEVLLLKRDNISFNESLLKISEVDEVLDYHRPNGANIRVVKNQEPLYKNKYENEDGSLNLNQLYAAYGDGYTIVINEIDRFWKPIKTLCKNVKRLLNHKTKGNMYLTPKNQKALLPHYDTHDVFVVQLSGKKHWKIYDDQYKTPLVNSFQPIFQREQLQGVKEIILEAGDMMYIPRGIPHEAYTTDDSSLHLTIGVYPTQWLDFFSKTLHNLAQTDISLRKALPVGYLNSEDVISLIKSKIEEISQTLCNDISRKNNIYGSVQLLKEELRSENSPQADGHFESLDVMDCIDLDTHLIKRKNVDSTVQQVGNISRIIFPGNVIRGPISIAPCLEFISENKGGFKINEIPLINDTNKIKLCKRLIRGGLLKVN
ncbi:cupin domain-containing protein [uncultured Tenacibaculum sp.]|uniref:cupin domain-containing protein n=1 Tax=uncultured Tenacibaculum sp. TaxID=174713 RepID=UPI002617B9F2|nr:cupin domain-containing protein [uncultured Tenacibaculum sp.]